MENYVFALKNNARILRNEMTEAEQLLWQKLRRKQLLGLQFYRQKPLLTYIVDFYCPKAKLVIELDGKHHSQLENKLADQIRDKHLENIGLLVLRFDNCQVLSDLDSVIAHIYQVILARL